MRTKAILMVIAMVSSIVAAPIHGQDNAPGNAPPDVKSLIAFSIRAEGETIGALREATPLVEWVVQVHVPVEPLGFVPQGDYYDLGRFKWTDAPRLERLVSRRSTTGERDQPPPATSDTPLRDALVEVMTPDWSLLSPQRYQYTFVRTMFLGSVRCFVFDVEPVNQGDGAFVGRIYVESKMFHVVRFTGVNRQVDAKLAAYLGKDASFRVDVWRANVNRTRWLPAYAYIEEVTRLGDPVRPLLRGQARFWGYDRSRAAELQHISDIVVDGPEEGAGQDVLRWPSPQRSRRLFDAEAEQNLRARLDAGDFSGVPGSANEMLEQVLNNLVVSNQLVLAAKVRGAVLLTSPFETFTIGNTIYVSRGLLDVIPSESVLAFVLAHQLAHNVLGHRKVDSRFSFSDVLRVSDRELLERLRFRYTPSEESAAGKKALEILERSPYKQQLADAGLFMQALNGHVTRLPSLIAPHFGEHVADVDHSVQNDEKLRVAGVLDPARPDQVAALALGSRLLVHPWDGRVEMLRPEMLVAPTVGERAEFRVTPFMPFLTYINDRAAATSRPAKVSNEQARTSARRSAAPASRRSSGSAPTPQPRAAGVVTTSTSSKATSQK